MTITMAIVDRFRKKAFRNLIDAFIAVIYETVKNHTDFPWFQVLEAFVFSLN